MKDRTKNTIGNKHLSVLVLIAFIALIISSCGGGGGGGTVYKEAIDKADKLYLTLVHGKFEGDTFFPKIDNKLWKSVKREDHMPDAKNEYPYSFIDFDKN